MKVEKSPVMEETEIQEHPRVKEEQEDQSISPDMEVDTLNNAEVRLPKSEPTSDCDLFPSSTAATVSVKESIDDEWSEADGSSSPGQSHSVEVIVELEQPPRDEKTCRFCGKSFRKDSFLIRHVERSHKGKKAFKCMRCNKEFHQRTNLVTHTRVHTGEKPYKCDHCEKTFAQNSHRIVHMRVHTGEKPYFCKNCGKSFSMSKHLRFCKSAAEKATTEENVKEEKPFKCFECGKEFKQKHQLGMHARVHTGEKPFSCDFCERKFALSFNRDVHMRLHTGEKPYFCQKCGKYFAYSRHLRVCKSKQNKRPKTFRCLTCGKTFHTDIELNLHMEVHESWKKHLSEKQQEPE
uniref:oocyte zinc finger protein XlCOF20-like n=1 Tax=Semicossyphus pulcher TaxID=241346 RepID=UPI0037E8A43B